MITKSQYEDGIRCRGVCSWCTRRESCYQYISDVKPKEEIKDEDLKVYEVIYDVFFTENNIVSSYNTYRSVIVAKDEESSISMVKNEIFPYIEHVKNFRIKEIELNESKVLTTKTY